MYHKTIVLGRLGRDPELRYTPGGTPVCTISVATDEGSGDTKLTIWYRVTCWNKTAEAVNQYTHKGDLVLVEGRMHKAQPYQARDGEWRASLGMTADRVQFVQTRRGDGAEVATPETNEAESIPF